MSGLPAHLLGYIENTSDLGAVTVDGAILHNINVMRQRVEKSKLSPEQKTVHLNLINQVLDKWETPERYTYIAKAAEAEKIYESQGLMGFEAVEGLSGFWSSIKNAASKVGGVVKSVAKVALPMAAQFIPGAGGLVSKIASDVMNSDSSGGGGGTSKLSFMKNATQSSGGSGTSPVIINNFTSRPVSGIGTVPIVVNNYPEGKADDTTTAKKWYQKTPAKIGIGVGGALAIGTIAYFVFRPKKETREYRRSHTGNGLGGVSRKKTSKKTHVAKVVKHKPIKKVELK